MKFLGSNQKTAAVWNRGLTIRLLRRHGKLSRNDISQMTQLQGSTLSYIVRELLDKSLVRTVGKRQSTLGRQKQVLLTLNPDLGWMLGASLRTDAASLVLLDAAGGRIDGMQTKLDGSLAEAPAQLREITQRWLKRRGTPAGKMLGVGIGIPGVVDADSGVVLRSSSFRAVNVPMQQLAADQFGVPVVVDHDACYGAFAEAMDGAAADVSHFAFFSLNTIPLEGKRRLNSFGSALYLQGKIYRGAFYAAGELTGPLEPPAMDLSPTDVAALADPDGGLPPALLQLAANIGLSLGPIVNLVDVQMVVIAGILKATNSRFISAVQAAVTEQLVGVPGRAVRVVRSAWEPEAAARGAALAAFDAVVADGQLFGDIDDRKSVRAPKETMSTA